MKKDTIKPLRVERPRINIAKIKPFSEIPEYTSLKKAADKKTKNFNSPKFLGDPEVLEKFSDCLINELSVESPEIRINEIYNSTPLPASNLILNGENLGHHELFEPQRDVCMLERFGLIMMDPDNKIACYKPQLPPVRISEALSLLGQCAGNYAHFLAEVLPRLLVADSYENSTDIPILADSDWTPHNHLKLIKIFNRHGREIIHTGKGQPASPYRLVDVSPTAYAPPEYRWFVEGSEMQNTPAEVYKFSEDALNLVRNFKLKTPLSKSPYGPKLFLGRRATEFSTGRNLVNMPHLAHMAHQQGFEAINTADMGVLEQIATFRAARVVIAPIGASMANLIFTPPGCKVICLSPIYDKANYYYFAKFLATLGHDLTYVVGKQIDGSNPHPFHRDYSICPDEFYKALAGITSYGRNIKSLTKLFN